tara:strand:- start:942 stop:1808 length:867 start_codon:yes stop_codon:yes gene_type:complete
MGKKLRLGIVGHGFVGKAMDVGFSKETEKYIVDPLYNNTIDDLANFNPELIFVCVPTPMSSDGSINSSIIEKVVIELSQKCDESIVAVKSTVIPSVLKSLIKYNNKIVYNPEFLREKHADLDFKNSEMVILGGEESVASKVLKAYKNHANCKTKNFYITDIASASLAKYAINTFLASKVLFFNEVYELYQNTKGKHKDSSWSNFIKMLSTDSRIGCSHLEVPGQDGKFGFGGACFPKDTMALIKYAEDIGVSMEVLKAVVRKNNKIRGSYVEIDSREKAQDINFDDKI